MGEGRNSLPKQCKQNMTFPIKCKCHYTRSIFNKFDIELHFTGCICKINVQFTCICLNFSMVRGLSLFMEGAEDFGKKVSYPIRHTQIFFHPLSRSDHHDWFIHPPVRHVYPSIAIYMRTQYTDSCDNEQIIKYWQY